MRLDRLFLHSKKKKIHCRRKTTHYYWLILPKKFALYREADPSTVSYLYRQRNMQSMKNAGDFCIFKRTSDSMVLLIYQE